MMFDSFLKKRKPDNGANQHQDCPMMEDEEEDSCDDGIIQLHDLRMSPIPSLRNRHAASSGVNPALAGTSRTANNHVTKVMGPPSLRFVRRGHHQYHHHHHHHHHSCPQPHQLWSNHSNKSSSSSRCCGVGRQTTSNKTSTSHHHMSSGGGSSHLHKRNSDRQKSAASKRLLCGINYSIPKIKDVNLIDKYSRFVFPASFAIFNVVYWSIYILL